MNMTPDAFRKAIKHGDLKAAKDLVNGGFDVAFKFKKGWTALHIACKAGRADIVNLLLSSKADVNALTELWRTPLDEAGQFKHPQIADSLRDKGGKHGFELSLAGAITAGSQRWVKHHLSGGADINARIDGQLPVCIAMGRGNWELFRYLLKKKPDVRKKQGPGDTPLHVAVGSNADVSVLAALVRLGADVNAVNDYGETPLYVASGAEDEDAVRFLIKGGADVKRGDPDSSTPVEAAIRMDNHELARLLIDSGATATIHQAAHCGHLDKAQQLLRENVDVDSAESATLRTPLFIAVQHDHTELAELFLESKADANAQEDYSYGADTPLHAAVHNGSARLVKLLLAHRADVDLQNRQGLTPLELAERRNFGHLVHIMEAHLDSRLREKAVEQHFTIHKVAELLSVEEAFVHQLIKTRKLRQLKLDAETTRIPESSLGRYLAGLKD